MIKANLLIVDDDQLNLDLFTIKLEKMSYKVHSASSGIDALKIMQRETIDILITDFRMPGMDGYEIIERSIKIDPAIQSIVVTGYSDIKTAIEVMGAGAFNYLQKPVNFQELEFTIQKGLEKRKLIQDIQNKQIELEEYRNQLEKLVESRTRTLTETNLKLKREIEERNKLEDSLREAKLIAEDANKAKSAFLANMSHEIRTPMTSAIGLLNLVLDTELLPKQKAYLEMARISTVIMHNLLNDILDFSKIESGKLILESISFDPRMVIKSVVDLQHFQAEEKKIELTCDIDNDVPRSLFGDPNRLRQIILNLVSNAIKFTQYGEVSIKCQCSDENSPDHPDQEIPYQCLHFTVQDTGIGIDKDKMDLIFEAFTQADNSTTRKFGGVGLGLNICSKLIAMMQGRLWVVSAPNQGSTFHFICKFAIDTIATNKIGHPGRIPDFHADPPRNNIATILIVEDDQVNQWVIQEILENEGYMTSIVSDGNTALKEISHNNFDIILLDLQLPDISGYEIVKKIRENERKSNISKDNQLPIIALTGFASDSEKKKCLSAGMNDFLAKPFNLNQLLSITKKYIHGRAINTMQHPATRVRKAQDVPVLKGIIFNEEEALARTGENRELLINLVEKFLKDLNNTIELLNTFSNTDTKTNELEHALQKTKDLAIEVGATNLADELFSLLMNIRKNGNTGSFKTVTFQNELDLFRNDKKIRSLLHQNINSK